MTESAPETYDPYKKVSRLPPLPHPLDSTARDLLEETRARGGDILNLHIVNAHAPRVSKAKRGLTFALRNDCDCPRLYREIAICRAAFHVDCKYELNHHLPLARRAGLSESQAAALNHWRSHEELFDEKQRAVLTFVDEICLNKGQVADETFSRLASFLPPQQIIELTLNATVYFSNGLYMKALGIVEDDPHIHPAPGRF